MQADQERQAEMQASMKKEGIGLKALAAARGDKQSGMAVLQELGLPTDLADDEDAGELYQAIAEQYGGFKSSPQSVGTLYPIEGPQGAQYATAQQAVGQTPYRAPQQGREPPSGYRWKADGSLETVPGGPSDPAGPGARKNTQPLRKEFRSLQSVKDYEAVLPLLHSARTAPDTPAGDLQLIYTVGKILDPGSVVREGELQLTQNAQPWFSKMVGQAHKQIKSEGSLPPETRQQFIEMLEERVNGYKQAYDKDFQQYSEYAAELNVDPGHIVGKHADSAYAKPKEKRLSPEEASKLPSGTRFVGMDGVERVKR